MNELSPINFEEIFSKSSVWDENQLSLRNEAHQRATLQCDAPAMVWHAASWPERELDPQNSRTIQEHNERLAAWLDRVNSLVKILGGTEVFHLNDGVSTGQEIEFMNQIERRITSNKWIKSVKPKGIEFITEWRDARIQTRVQLFNDFVTVTFVLSCDDAADPDNTNNEDTIVGRLREFTRQATHPNRPNAQESADFLFVKVWDLFTQDLLVKTLGNKTNLNAEDSLRALVPGRLFLSLRGVIIDVNENMSIGYGLDQETFSADKSNITSDYHQHNLGESDNVTHLTSHFFLEKYENFITNGGFGDDDRDFVAAGILHDRAIFVSPFGAKSSKDPKDRADAENPRRVTRFTILTKSKTNSHEMGRVVANITALCTFQIAAIKDINLVRQVGTQIRLAGDRLNHFSIRFSRSIERLGRPPRNLEVKLCQFETELDELSRLPTGGLPYRVYRSQYYANEFKRRLDSLGFEPLEYWQSPNSFFEKRLFAVFDYVQIVGQRMRNLRSRLYETLEAVQTKTLVDLTSRVHKIHRTGQLQSLILFVIAVSAFCGEIFEPLFQVGRNHPDFFRQILHVLGADGIIFQVPELYQRCLILESGSPPLRAGVDIFVPGAVEEGGTDVCKPVFRVLGYAYGFITALIMAFLYMILAPLWRGSLQFLAGLTIDAWERIRLKF